MTNSDIFANADKVFKYFSIQKKRFVDILTSDPIEFVKNIDTLLGKDSSCMTTTSARRVMSQAIRCQNCEYLSRLVADEKRQVDVPFCIEFGKQEKMWYVLESTACDPEAVYDVYKVNNRVYVEMYPFTHRLILDYLVDICTGQNNTISGWICGHEGYIVRRSYRLVNTGLDPKLVFSDFINTVKCMVSAKYINYDIKDTSLVFDDQDGCLRISISNGRASSIVWGGKNIRITGQSFIRRINRSGHPVDINSFSSSVRFRELIETSTLDEGFAVIYTAYSLITCLLLTGRWFVHVNSEVKDLYGNGIEAIIKYTKECRNAPSQQDIDKVLRCTTMSKERLTLFLEG